MRKFAVWFVLYYLRFFARIALFIARPKVIGIAGSVGKTSVKYALAKILGDVGRTLTTSGNSETGVPLGILGIKLAGYRFWNWLSILLQCPFRVWNTLGVNYLIVEMGIDDPDPPKNMAYLLTIVKPDIAVIVTESAAHTEQFEKTLTENEKKLSAGERRKLLIKRIAAEDITMITQQCRIVVFNADSHYITEALEPYQYRGLRFMSFGHSARNNLAYVKREVSLAGTRFGFTLDGQRVAFSIRSYALPAQYREVFGAAALAAYVAGVPTQTIQRSLETFSELPKGRATLLKGIRDSVIIDSSYNASRASVDAFLGLLRELKEKTHRPVVFAFGDMRELGQEAAIEHAAVAEQIPSVADYLFCVGPLTKQYVLPRVPKEIFKEVEWFSNAHGLGVYLRDQLPPRALVLIKGSQNQIFLEEAIKYILVDKGDEKKLCRQEGYWMSRKRDAA